MAFENVQIQSTRNGVSGVVGYRDDLAQGDIVAFSLTSAIGVTSAQWNLIGRPRGSAAGGAGPEPVSLASALTSAITVDSDVGAFRCDGTYVVECVLNPGAPSETRKTVIVARSTGLTVAGPSGSTYVLRKPGGFENLEDTKIPARKQGWADQDNGWKELVRALAQGGGITVTLAGAYGLGAVAADQTLALADARGGGLVVDGSSGGFTGATASLQVKSAAGGPVWFDRATGNVGWGVTAPLDEIHVKSASPGVRLDRTGGKAIAIENVTDNIQFIDKAGPTILAQVIGTGGIRADLGIGIGAAPSTSATLAMGAGSTAAVSTANTGRIRYNEVSQQWETSVNGAVYAPFGAGAGTFVELDSINTTGNKLSAYAFPATGHVEAVVATVRDVFYLDRTSTLTADGITIVTALGGTGRWIRRMYSDPFWQAVTSWGIDPAGTFGTPGSDEAVGSPSAPIKSIAEWRRRIRGAQYGAPGFPTIVQINALSSSTNIDDGFFYGYTSAGTTANVIVIAAPTVIGSGTLTGAVAYSGNNRGTVTDSALPTSWASSYGLSSTSGSRYIRKTGGSVQALILPVETVAKTVMIGLPTDTSETTTGTPTANAVAFNNGDAYQVVSRLKWPQLVTSYAARARLHCLDVSGQPFVVSFECRDQYVLCGFLGNYIGNAGQITFWNCGFFGASFVGGTFADIAPLSCSFVNTSVELIGGGDWQTTDNVFLNSKFDNHHGHDMEGIGTLHFFDNTTTLINLDRGANIANGSIVGSNNTGKLVTVNNGSYYYPGSSITATTSDALPYTVAGTSYAAPRVDQRAGCGVYNGTAQFLVPDATDAQAAVPLHQVSALIIAGGVTLTQGSVAFAGVGGGITQDNANFFWDDTNNRLGIGTPTPTSDLSISRSASAVVGINLANANAGAAAIASLSASNGTASMAVGITGTGFTGGGSTPNLGASTTFLNAAVSGPLYLGSIGVITMQTGPTQAERLKILATGEVQLSSLTAGGMVKASAGGQLAVGVAGTDFLAPIAGPFTLGSVLFAGAAGAVAQDNAAFFWDDTNVRLGIGNAAPAASIHAKGASPGIRLDRTGGVAFEFTNVADTLTLFNRTSTTTLVTIPSTGGIRSDLGIGIGAGVSTSATLAMGAGSAAAVSAVNTGRIRYNEVLQQWETSTNAGVYTPFGASGGLALEFDGISTGAVQLSLYTPPTTGHVEAVVKTVRDVFYLDRASTLTADGITVVTALGGGRWIRRCFSDVFWQQVTSWGVDPASTFSTPGNDENVGSPAAPIKSIAEWRRRIRGAQFTTSVVINALSGSTNPDDGFFVGFTTNPQTVFVSVLASPTVVGTGTLTAGTVPYSGNNRAVLVDSAVPTGTWAGAGYITTTARTRYVRKVGAGARAHAPLILDTNGTTAHSAMPGIATSIDDGVVSFFPSPNEISFVSGDSYEVYSLPAWPQLQVGFSASVGLQNCDIFPVANPTGAGSTKYRLCGIVGTNTFAPMTGSASSNMYMCCFAILQPAGAAFTGSSWVIGNCAFLNSLIAISGGGPDLVFTASNVFVNGFNRYYKGCNLSVGNFRHYDFTSHPLMDVESAARVSIEGGFVGSGNTQKLVSVLLGGVVQGASGITAATTDVLPWQVSGVSYATPVADAGTGNAIYAGNTTTRTVNGGDAVDPQDYVTLHQAQALASGAVPTFTTGSVIFAGAGGTLAQDNANFFWDDTNNRLGIGGVPGAQAPLDVIQSSALTVVARISNSNTSTTASAAFNASNLTATAAFGMTGTNWVEAGGSTIPNRVANQMFLTTALAGPSPSIYVGSYGFITIQTGTTQAERLRILATGEIRIPGLSAGGVVKAAVTTGQLGIGLITATDIADDNVLMTKLEPIVPGKILGNDGPATQSPFDISIVAPITMVPGSGQLTFATGFTTGAVVFQGVSQIQQDAANFFWDDTNNRLGVGTNAPLQQVDVRNDANGSTMVLVRNQGAGTSALAQFVAASNFASGLGIAVGATGSGYAATTARPNVGANTAFVVPYVSSSNLYVGAPGTLIFGTGSPVETNRLQILPTGQLNVSSLIASGVVTAAASSGQLAVTTMVAGQIPFGAASGGGIAQDSTLFWDNTSKRLGVGTNSPGVDINAKRGTGNTFTTILAETSGLTALYGAQFMASNDTGAVGLFGATGSGFTPFGTLPNLGANTAFVYSNNSNPLYLGSTGDVTIQCGITQTERLRAFASGGVEVFGGFGINANPISLSGGPYIMAALAAGNADKILCVLNGGATVTATTGSLSYLQVAAQSNAFNNAILSDLSQVQIDAPTWVASVGATNVIDFAATLLITNAPNMVGGHWVINTGQSYALAVKAGDVLFNNKLTVSGNLFVGGNAILDGPNTVVFGNFQTQAPIGFFSQLPIGKQTVTGSKASGAAWASLLSAMTAYGLVIDTTTP